MNIKSSILQRVSSEPMQVDKSLLCQEPEFIETVCIKNAESMLFTLAGHQPLTKTSLSFDKIKAWCAKHNILVQESLQSPNFLSFIKCYKTNDIIDNEEISASFFDKLASDKNAFMQLSTIEQLKYLDFNANNVFMMHGNDGHMTTITYKADSNLLYISSNKSPIGYSTLYDASYLYDFINKYKSS